MNVKNIILTSAIAVSGVFGMVSCDYLDANEYLHEVENLNDIWTNRSTIREAWAACYGNFTDLVNVDGTHTMINYDEGHAGMDSYVSLHMAQGKYNSDTPIRDFWSWQYSGIRKCSKFIEDSHLASDKLLEEGEVESYVADARFMRAYYHSFLMEFYGPVVIIDKTIDYSDEENYPTDRASIDECVAFIISELDIAMEHLEANSEIGPQDMGRPTKEAAMALKARVLLWAASPLVNGNPDYVNFVNPEGEPFFNVGTPDEQKWKDAATAYKELIDLNEFELFTVPANDDYITVPLGDFEGNDIEWPNGPAGIDPYRSYKGLFAGGEHYWNSEVIWQANWGGQQANLTALGFPRSYNSSQGGNSTGRYCAVQKLVDAFHMNNGKTIKEDAGDLYLDHSFSTEGDGFYILGDGSEENSPIITGFKTGKTPRPAYPPNRGLNREARFYATIGYSGMGYVNNNNDIHYANYMGNQLDGYMATDRPSVRTGYTITKWISDKDRHALGSAEKQYPIFRLAEVYLSYAEALNEYDPSNPDIVKYLNLVRYRAGLPGYVLASKEVNRERIIRERYVEFAFESKRYFDARRLREAERGDLDQFGNSLGMNGPVYGQNYLDGGSGFYNRTIIDGYIFKKRHYFLPIPYTQVANHWASLIQNPGW